MEAPLPPEAPDAPQPPPAPPAGARAPLAWRRVVAKYLLLLPFGLATLLALAGWLLDSAIGHRLLVEIVADADIGRGVRLQVGRINGSVYRLARLENVTLRDERGVFLRLPEVAVDWRPLALWNRRVDVRALVAHRGVLLRAPRLGPADPNAPLLPDWDVRLDRLVIEHVSVAGLLPAGAPKGNLAKGNLAKGDAAQGNAGKGVAGKGSPAKGNAGQGNASQGNGSQANAPQPAADGPRSVSLYGRLALRRRTSASLALRARFGTTDRLETHADINAAANLFDLGLVYDAPAGGVLAALAGDGLARRVRLGGSGSFADWHGGFLAETSGQRSAALLLAQRRGAFSLGGRVWTKALLPAGVVALVGDNLAVWGRGHLGAGAIEGRLGAAGARGRLGLAGRFDSGPSGFAHTALVLDAAPGLPLGATTRVDGLKLHALVSGPLGGLAVRWRASAARAASGHSALLAVSANGQALRQAGRWRLPLELAVGHLVTGDPTLDPQLANGHLQASLAYDGRHLTADDLTLRFARLAARLRLKGEPDQGTYALSGQAEASGWPLAGVGPLTGRANLGAALAPGGHWRVLADAHGLLGPVSNAGLARLAGERLRIEAALRLGDDQPLMVSRGALHGDLLDLAFTGQPQGDGRMAYTGAGQQRSYGHFSGTLALGHSGVWGDVLLDDPVPTLGVKQVRLVVVPDGPGRHAISFNGQSSFGAVSGDLGLALPEAGPAEVEVRSIDLFETTVTGSLRVGSVPVAGGGVASGVLGDLALAGGGVKGHVHLAPQGEGQGLDAGIDLARAAFGGDQPLSIGAGHIAVHGALLKNHTTIDASAALQGVGKGRLFVGRLAASAKLVDGNGQVTASLAGRRGSRFAVETMATIAPGKVAVLAHGTFAGAQIAMPARAQLTARLRPDGTTEGWQLAPAELDFGGGRMIAQGFVGNGALDLHLGLADMPLSLTDVVFADIGLGGRVSGLIDWHQPREAMPTGEAHMMVRGLTRSSLLLTSRPVDVALVGRLEPDALELRAVSSNGDSKGGVNSSAPSGRLQARISALPAAGTLTDRLERGALFAQLRYSGPADAPWRLMALQQFDLTGPLALAVDVGGTLADPQIRGSASGSGLRLQSAQTGTDIQAITASGSFAGSRLSLASLAGRTVGGGTVDGSATVDFATPRGSGPAIDIRLSAKKAQLVNRPDMAVAATGPLRIVSDGQTGTIAGRLHIDSALWRLGRAASNTDLPVIPTTEINRRVDIAPQTEHEVTWSFLIDAATTRGVRLVGLGLDSQWGADIRLRGTVDDPVLLGRADLVEGRYEFSGKSFDLSHGRVTLDGTSPPDPKLDIGATAAITGYTATLSVTGSALRPEIAFSSTPALPEEELLARLLFGDSITQISAPEAVQLGSALAGLHSGAGLDVINRLRGAIGLDRLRIVSPDATINRQTGVAVGKYLGRHVYAEFVTDGRGYTASNLEWRLTSWLALLGSVSTVGRQSVNARVSHDY